MNYYAAGFFYNPQSKKVLLHHRDDRTPINPNKWGFFGGMVENEDEEEPIKTFIREVKEELGVVIVTKEANHLCDYPSERGYQRYVYFVKKYISDNQIVLGEGQGWAWFSLEEALKQDLTQKTRRDLEFFRGHISRT